ncbi:hypothetical protein FGLOB1_14470 [Fusarium globosum]|uniref:Uncharacterized protein n=1 Tax=Fusarium globosum TaxID=78864 RepID=A0A8H6CUQ3_9HYPO|nr:hypothetical protein FGLOB1_14470 [Fusarium globosum]
MSTQAPNLGNFWTTEIVITGIYYGLVRVKAKTVVKCEIPASIPDIVLLNADADNPGPKVGITPIHRNSLWLMRAAEMWESRTIIRGLAGPTPLSDLVDFSFVALGIEVSTYASNGNFPPTHDDIISIHITNAGWEAHGFEHRAREVAPGD